MKTVNLGDVYDYGILDDPKPDDKRPDPRDVATCMEFLEKFTTPQRSWNLSTSYTLKHMVESWLTEQGCFRSIPNGSMVAALLKSGYKVRRATAGSPNVVAALRIQYTDSLYRDDRDPMVPR
jgi:hypothetical protein